MVTVDERALLKRSGRKLAAIRQSKGYTQAQLAEMVEMSVVAIAYLETGKRWACIATLARLAAALNRARLSTI